MCFSAEASFTAATILCTIGIVTLKNVTFRSQLCLAGIPFLFALQQFSEGILWMQLNHSLPSGLIIDYAKKIFLVFAFLIWPVWIPLAMLLVEKINKRKNLLYLNLAFGIALSAFNLISAIQHPITVNIVNHSLQYLGNAPSQMFLYPLVVLAPNFISSIKNMWIFGVLIVLGYFLAEYYYSITFISVWCFFAAIVSLFIYKIIKDLPINEAKRTIKNRFFPF